MSTESKALGKGTSADWVRWLVATLVLGVLAFLTSSNAPLGGFWGVQAERAAPAGVQMLLFILLSAIQSIAFGLGIAFLIFGFPLTSARMPANQGWARATHLAIAWSLFSWWPHSNFHQSLSSDNLSGLLAIEYGFHVTLIVAGLIVAYFFVNIMRQEKMLSQ
jgi:hypothetical protein